MSFQAPKALERDFERKLKKVAQNVTKIISAGSDATTIAYRLNVYADQLGPWADKVIAEVVSKSNRHNLKEWRALSKSISDKMRSFYTEGAVAHAMRDLSEVGAGLIKSLPIDAGKKAVEYAQTAAVTGMRHEDLIEQIQGLSEITHARAQLIARTEVARQQSLLTQTRAVSIGSEGYIWRTAEDGRVRPSHAALNGRFIRWDDPPLVDGKYRAHAGQIFNCRCYPEPVVPDVTPQKSSAVVSKSVLEPSVPKAPVVVNTEEERTRIFKSSGAKHLKKVVEAFDQAPQDALQAFDKYGANIAVHEDKGFACDMQYGTVLVPKSNPRSGPYSRQGVKGRFQEFTRARTALRHEYGHALDSRIGRAVARAEGWEGLHVGTGISEMDDSFRGSVWKYAEELCDIAGDNPTRRALELSAGSKRLDYKLSGWPQLSDICDAMSGGEIHGDYGHGAEYFKKPGRPEREIFAQLTAVYTSGDKARWDQLKGIFPDLVSAYEAIIQKAAMGGF